MRGNLHYMLTLDSSGVLLLPASTNMTGLWEAVNCNSYHKHFYKRLHYGRY